MELHDVLTTTFTCRAYRPDPVPDDVLGRVLSAARWAPTGGNRQGVSDVLHDVLHGGNEVSSDGSPCATAIRSSRTTPALDCLRPFR